MFRFIFNFFLACYPILSAYKGFFSLDLGSILVFIFGLLCLISEPLKLPRYFYGYWPFFIIALACCILSSGTIPLWLVLYTVNFIFATSYGNLNQLLKIYSLLVYASVFYFIFLCKNKALQSV